MNLFENLRTLKESESQLYGIDYRNMHKGYHGLIVFDNEEEAIACYNELKETQSGYALDFIDYVDIFEEIDYRDIQHTDNGLFYDDIKIVNDVSIDLYEI